MNIIHLHEPLEDLHEILAEQNRALGKAYAALSNIRAWMHERHLDGCRIGGTTLANLLNETIREIVR